MQRERKLHAEATIRSDRRLTHELGCLGGMIAQNFDRAGRRIGAAGESRGSQRANYCHGY